MALARRILGAWKGLTVSIDAQLIGKDPETQSFDCMGALLYSKPKETLYLETIWCTEGGCKLVLVLGQKCPENLQQLKPELPENGSMMTLSSSIQETQATEEYTHSLSMQQRLWHQEYGNDICIHLWKIDTE